MYALPVLNCLPGISITLLSEKVLFCCKPVPLCFWFITAVLRLYVFCICSTLASCRLLYNPLHTHTYIRAGTLVHILSDLELPARLLVCFWEVEETREHWGAVHDAKLHTDSKPSFLLNPVLFSTALHNTTRPSCCYLTKKTIDMLKVSLRRHFCKVSSVSALGNITGLAWTFTFLDAGESLELDTLWFMVSR